MRKQSILPLLLITSALYSCQQSASKKSTENFVKQPATQVVKAQEVHSKQPEVKSQQPEVKSHAEADYVPFLTRERLPYWVDEWFMENQKFTQAYTVSDSLNPFYLEGDFNADKEMDCAVYLKERKSNKKGFVILDGKTQKHHIIAAGVAYDHAGDPSDDLEWMNIWRIVRADSAAPGVQGGPNLKLKGDVISIEASETGGGLIYWDGKGYKYFHQTC